MFDVAIVGAGVIGAMVARELSRYKLRVCLLEKQNDVAMGASKANSGIIHGGHDPIPGTLKAKLNREGNPLLYEAARELSVPHKQNGALVCAFGTPDQEKAVENLLKRGQSNGISGLKILTGLEARRLEPNLSPQVSMALYIPTSGIICPYELTLAAVGNAMDNGVELFRNFEVVKIQHQDRISVHSADGRMISSRYLVNCAGGFSDCVAHMAGDAMFRIIPRAGEYMLLDKNEGSRVSHTIFQVPTSAGKGILVTPTVDGNLLTGPTAQLTDGPDSTETTAEGLQRVRSLALRSVPSIDFRQVITSFTGVRSSVKDGDFHIQPSSCISNLLHVAAIDSPGLTCCVSAARYAVNLLREMGLTMEPDPNFSPFRENPRKFREMSMEEKDRYIQQHPAYGKVVCRCESVSLGEIQDAIRRNPPAWDVDGVKRRTRAGMGRCQGGFCSGTVMKILASEQGIPMEQVTKCGKGSEYLLGRL